MERGKGVVWGGEGRDRRVWEVGALLGPATSSLQGCLFLERPGPHCLGK